MREDIKFLKYELTPECKHIGIAHVLLFNKIVLRYKIVPTKDGLGTFVAMPSYKREQNGEERWHHWFLLDSQSFAEEVTDVIKDEVYKISNPQQQQAQTQPFVQTQQHQQATQQHPHQQFQGNIQEDNNLPF